MSDTGKRRSKRLSDVSSSCHRQLTDRESDTLFVTPAPSDKNSDWQPPKEMTVNWNSTGHGSKRQRLTHKQRHVCVDEDDEDDDEPLPPKVEVVKQEGSAIPPSKKSMNAPRLVLLTLYTRSAYPLRSLEKEELVRKISKFVPELVGPSGVTRIEITERLQHDEDTVLHMLEYLKSSRLRPFQDGFPTHEQLEHRLSLYNLSQELGIANLEHAVAEQIERHHGIDVNTFLKFAAVCYKQEEPRPKITPSCSMGKAIKRMLARHLPELVRLERVDEIKTSDGPLATQLFEVLMEEYIANKAKKAVKAE